MLVIVVRYFGGVKLGVSGLINAYKTAAEALSQAKVIEKIIQAEFIVSFDYLRMSAVMKLVKEFELEILSQQFAERCQMRLSVWRSMLGEVKSKLSQLDVMLK